ncbi:hypothetical protein, partial [Bacillus cereus]|uniref:hypothetical protein n=3 Tax=Bacillus cereus TaxID=1396 RepID=UPI001D070A13
RLNPILAMHAQPNIGCWSTKEGFPVVTSKKYDVNMLGLLNGMQAVLPPMIVSKTNTLMGSYHITINLRKQVTPKMINKLFRYKKA